MLYLFAGPGGVTRTVGPTTAGACGGADCDFNSIHAAIDASAPLDIITVYRRTDDAANNECSDEHVNINVANLTVQGASTTNRASVTPVFGGTTKGDVHDPGFSLGTSPAWTSWFDITSDTNAPGTWTWSDVTNLDVDATAIVSNGNLWVYKVELRVTYTP